MEELFKELSKFARENRKALEQAEQWLNGNEFDGNLADAWDAAINELPPDWRTAPNQRAAANESKLAAASERNRHHHSHAKSFSVMETQRQTDVPGRRLYGR